jgi:hypothetical protein
MNIRYLKQKKKPGFQRANITRVLAMILICWSFISCEKEKEYAGTASLCIVNAVPDDRPLVPNFTESGYISYIIGRRIAYNLFQLPESQYSSYSGSQRVRLFLFPDTTEKDAPLFDLRLELPVGSINTLFLMGTPSAPDTLFIRDEIPYFAAGDSVMGIRFVNLSAGSRPVSVNIKGLSNTPEVNSLEYKNITGFKRYPVTAAIGGYIFEFHDAVTGDLITSFDTGDIHGENTGKWIYRPLTLVFQGIPAGTGSQAQTVMLVHSQRN